MDEELKAYLERMLDQLTNLRNDWQNFEGYLLKDSTGTGLPAPPPLTGADLEKWAAQFLLAFALADRVKTEADRLAFVTGWFRDAMVPLRPRQLLAAS
jgi:hypothetical protein